MIFTAKDRVCISDVFPDSTPSTTGRPPVGFQTRCHDNYRSYIVDLGNNVSQEYLTRIWLDKDVSDYDIIDIDNDGKSDFVEKEDDRITIRSEYKKNTAGDYQYSKYISTVYNGEKEGLNYGDFNGDGKVDFIVPEKFGFWGSNNPFSNTTPNWRIYTNTGSGFTEQYQPSLFLHQKEPITTNSYEYLTYYNFNKDINGDGKTDLVSVESMIFKDKGSDKDSSFNLQIKINDGLDASGNIIFRDAYTDRIESPAPDPFVPLNISARIHNIDRFIIINHERNRFFAYDFLNIPNLYTFNKIKQGGITTEIDYKELDPSVNPGFYAPVKKEQYPYVELDKVSQSYAVSQLRQTIPVNGVNKVRKQDFRYRDMIMHLQGSGMIGFRQTARSSWYADGFENTKIWSGAEMDPQKEGIPIKEWSIRTNTEDQIFPADLSLNNAQLISFKSTDYKIDKLLNGVKVDTFTDADKPKIVTAIVPTSTTSKNFITNDATVDTVEYDDYYLPKKTISSINNGFAVKTTSLEYLHNLTGVGKNYYVGRPKSKVETMQVYGDTKGAKEDYTYENNLLKTQKTWNRDNSGWLQENYTYDGFGNITQKVSSNSIDGNTQTTKNTYEAKGRFVTNKIDNLGLETNITYNDWGQVLTQIDPLGNTLTNTYDAWGKLLTSKSNLAGTSTYTYEKLSNGDTKTTAYSPDNGQKISFSNKLGQNYKSSTKAFAQGQYVSKTVEYDVLGRKIKESEPYFEGSETPKWNVIAYDDTSFPGKVTATAFNGKQMETSVSGKTTIVKELNGYKRTTSKTTDALGNVISSTDKGGTITFTYNAAGEQTQAQYGRNIVKTTYDAWGNKKTFYDPSNGLYEYEYQGYFGTVSKIKSPKGTKEFAYNSKGQLTSQTERSTDGTSTNKTISFNYDSKGRIIGKSGTSNGKSFSSYVNFDAQGRTLSSGEDSNGKYFIQKGITYDDKARVTSYEKSLYSSGTLTKVTIENVYSNWSGDLYQVKDKTSGKILWQLESTNAKGLVINSKLGGTTINNLYDQNYFLNSSSHTSTSSAATVLQVGYSFNAIKNELTSRTRGGDFNLTELFTYDDNNRLLNWTNPKTGQISKNVYDEKGRITENDQVGKINFENTTSLYRPSSVELNAAGQANYTNDLIQSILYNENNDPVFINGEKGDVAFEYGLSSMRQLVNYGGNFQQPTTNSQQANSKFTKFYSEDGSYEILRDNLTGKEKHLLYIGGSPYESNIVYLKNYTESSGSYKFLHKDYLGSILAVTDESGNVVEQRHYDAWGNFTHLKIGNGAITTDKNTIDNTALLVDRGYTSHEHFAEVGVIHMNGRLYDPLLRRFLNADENIQDPNNTQNYNKYGYVLNNPLMYSDPSGEFWFATPFIVYVLVAVKAALIGAAIGAGLFIAKGLMTNNWSGFGKSILMGALTGVVSGGLGQVFSASGFWATVGNGALSGAGSGGITSIINGTNFLEGLAKGAVIGGAMAAVSYGIGKLFQGKDTIQLNADGQFSYDGQKFANKQELMDYIQKNNGDVSTIMKKLKISDIELASETNLPSEKVTFDKGFMWELKGSEKSQLLAKTIYSDGYSKIWISPGLKGVNVNGHYLTKSFINHEFIHSYHVMKGLTNTSYLERSAWSYQYAYARANGLNVRSFLDNIKRYGGFNIPQSYKWSSSALNKFIKLF